jgi:fatty-acyl-CoA synthase
LERLDLAQVSTIGDLLLKAAVARPDHPALVFPDVSLTYAELAEASITAARTLSGLGIRRGDTVGLLMPNGPELVATLVAAQLLGATVLPLNIRFRERELAHAIRHAGVAVLVVADAAGERVDLVGRLLATFPALGDAPDPWALELADAPGLRSVLTVGDAARPGLLGPADADTAAARVTRSASATRH